MSTFKQKSKIWWKQRYDARLFCLSDAACMTELNTNLGSQLLYSINSWANGKFEWNLGSFIFQIISVIDGWGIFYELALSSMSLDLTAYKSTFIQVMAWCRQATSHYLSQCWPRSLSPYGVTRLPNELSRKTMIRSTPCSRRLGLCCNRNWCLWMLMQNSYSWKSVAQ